MAVPADGRTRPRLAARERDDTARVPIDEGRRTCCDEGRYS